MKSRNKRGALQGVKLIFSIFVIVFLLIIFYVWIKDNVEAATKKQAETIAAEVELQNFFSELVKKHGIEIVTKDADDIIEKFAASYIALPKGSYDASCSGSTDKACTLSITSKETLKVIGSWSLAVGSPITWLLIKAIGLNVLQETSQDAYLPVSPGNAMKFSLTMKVKWG